MNPKKEKVLIRKVNINHRNGQASVTLPKKFFKKWVGAFPKEIKLTW